MKASGYKKTELFDLVRSDLLKQIETNGPVGMHFVNMVDDYMSLWITKSMLVADIESKGVFITYDNGGGQKGRKRNDSVADLVKVNAQMLKVLEKLNLEPVSMGVEEDEGP